MIVAIAFALAAGAGALARAEATGRWNRGGFAFGTFAVNVVGAFALGLLHDRAPAMTTIVGVGALGAFTTFSGLAHDAIALASTRRVALAAGYVTATCAAGIAAAALGVAIS